MRTQIVVLTVLMSVVLYPGCSSDDTAPEVLTGFLEGTIIAFGTSNRVVGARVLIFDAGTNAPIGGSLATNATGLYRVELPEGVYIVKISKQGFEDLPPRTVSPLPLNVTRRQTTTYSVQLRQSSLLNTGSVSGRVLFAGSGRGGVSVTATGGGNAFSSVTDGAGEFFIFNVLPDTYTVRAWVAGFTRLDFLRRTDPG